MPDVSDVAVTNGLWVDTTAALESAAIDEKALTLIPVAEGPEASWVRIRGYVNCRPRAWPMAGSGA